MTFFDWPLIGGQEHGTDSIAETAFRVNGRAALDYWVSRFEASGVAHEDITEWAGFARLPFTDPEGQRLALVDDGGASFEGEVWDGADVPPEHAIRGFWGVTLSVPNLPRYEPIFSLLMGWERVTAEESDKDVLYAMDGGGPGRFVRVLDEGRATRAQLGAGGVHHVAFRVRDAGEQRAWMARLDQLGVPHSGEVDRYYFRSVYFRISNGILFELATDEPGFTADEPLATLGQRLALPPFLEPRRAQIEAGLKPLE
jgi:glyoxalase family protein